MADLRVRFIGDLGNLRTFFSSIAGQANQTFAQLEALSRKSLSSQLGVLPRITQGLGPRSLGGVGEVGLGRVTLELDRYNNTIKQTAQTLLKLPGGSLLPIAETTQATANFDDVIKRLQAYSTEYSRLSALINAQKGTIAGFKDQTVARQAVLQAPAAQQRTVLQQLRSDLQSLNAAVDTQRTRVATNVGAARTSSETVLNRLLAERASLIGKIGVEQRKLNALEAQYATALTTDTALLGLRGKTAQAEAARLRLTQELLGARAAKVADVAALYAAGPPVPKNIQTVLDQSPQLSRLLQRAGLGQPQGGQAAVFGQQGFGKALELQKAQFHEPVRDLVRDVTRVSGSFYDAKGQLVDFSAELDKNGKVVTRFGGQLSGAGSVLRSISRDFQKVIEWTVATTVVFGSLRYATEQLGRIKELDAALQRFAITAQIGPRQLSESFDDLSKIAFDTATPLIEIISAADDIALATQKAGQSTEEWRKRIYDLTTAVGIFTNLTGVDTVKSTDLLTAAMKQLNLEGAEVTGLLSKITAVAGGQSQAIADITQGLAVMAEAGKQAGLSVDQQIAAVQVLSQVTSKSPAEVATAFKNLVGSLGSPAALKAFDKFGIDVRDRTTGALRNILDVYGEISQKIKSGIIAEPDVQGLVRAISGGPRRAPDAAALLGAIDQITAAQQKSAAATNEAQIANAKLLDTTQAKLVKLQNTLDKVTFEKFGGIYKDAIITITNFLQTLLDVFNKIPTGVVAAAIQLAGFFLALRVGIKVVSALFGGIRALVVGLGQLVVSLGAASKAQQQFNTSTILGPNGLPIQKGVPTPGRFANIRAGLGGLAAGAAVGGAISAATGGNQGQIAGGVLQGLGIGLAILPDPTLLTKVGGGILFVAGTVLQLASAQNELDDRSIENAIKILDTYSRYKEAALNVDALSKSQADLATQITELNETQNKTVDDGAKLAQFQKDYVLNTLSMIDATKQLNDASKELSDQFPELLTRGFSAAGRGELNAEELEKLIRDYQAIVLQAANPNINLPDKGLFPTIQQSRFAPFTGSTQATIPYVPSGGIGSPFPVSRDLEDLKTGALDVKTLFNDTGTQLTAVFEITGENIGLVSDAITALKENNDPLAASLAKTFDAFVSQNDGIKQAANNLAIYQSYLDGLSIFDPSKATELQSVFDLGQAVIGRALTDRRTAPPARVGDRFADSGGSPGEIAAVSAQRVIDESLRTGKINYKDIQQLAAYYYETLDEGTKKIVGPLEFEKTLLGSMGFNLERLGYAAEEGMGAISEQAIAASEALEELRNTAIVGIDQDLLKLKFDFQGGLIDADVYAKDSARLNALRNLLVKTTTTWQETLDKDPGFDLVLNELQASFSDYIGFSDAASLTTDEFVQRIITLAEQAGLTASQINEITAKLTDFSATVNAIKTKLRISVEVTGVDHLRKIISALVLDQRQLFRKYGEAPDLARLEELLKSLNSIGDTADDVAEETNRIISSGRTPKPTSSSAGNGPDVSTIDLPEEIAKAINRDSLIQQAIKNAKDLQAKIPGATKEAADDIVELLNGTKHILEVRGVKDDLLRKALEELADIEKARLDFDTKADTIRRIRVGAGSFAAIANVPLNSQTGVSVGGPEGPITINLNLNGQLLTPAQFEQLANRIGAVLKSELSNG